MLNSYVWVFEVSEFGTLGVFWEGRFLKNDIVWFYGIITYWRMISWLEHWLNNVLLDILRLHQKSGCAAIVTLPTISSFSKLAAFPRCKVAEEQKHRRYIRVPLGRLNTALVQILWQIEPLHMFLEHPKGLIDLWGQCIGPMNLVWDTGCQGETHLITSYRLRLLLYCKSMTMGLITVVDQQRGRAI